MKSVSTLSTEQVSDIFLVEPLVLPSLTSDLRSSTLQSAMVGAASCQDSESLLLLMTMLKADPGDGME